MFPISNWTELDVWSYIKRENIALPTIYFAHERECILRDGRLLDVYKRQAVQETRVDFQCRQLLCDALAAGTRAVRRSPGGTFGHQIHGRTRPCAGWRGGW